MKKNKNKKRSNKGLGDDPLSWINKNDSHSGQSAARQSLQDTDINKLTGGTSGFTDIKNSSGKTEAVPARSDKVIVLDQVLTIADANKLKEQLLPYLKATGEVTIDGSKVEMIDTATIQVLAAFLKSLQQRNIAGKWVGVSKSLLNTSRLLGLTKQLGL